MQNSRARGAAFVSTLLAFLLSLFLALAIVLPVVWVTALSPGAFSRTFQSVGYYGQAVEDAREKARNRLIPTGLPGDVLEGVLTEGDMQTLLVGTLRYRTEDEALEETTTNMRARLLDNIHGYLVGNGLSQEVPETEIENIADTVIEMFVAESTFPSASNLRELFRLYSKLAVIGVIACGGLCIFISKLLRKLAATQLHKYLQNIAYACGGCGLMLTILPLVGIVGQGHTRLGIAAVYLYNFVGAIYTNTLWALLFAGLAALAASVVFAVFSERERRVAALALPKKEAATVQISAGPDAGLPAKGLPEEQTK